MNREGQKIPNGESQPAKGWPVSRRAFLQGGAAAAALAVLAACRGSSVTPTPTATPEPSPTPTPSPTPDTYVFFNADEAATVKAAFARIVPGNPQEPGAIEAGAHIYIDRALAGAYSSRQQAYRSGLASMASYSRGKFNRSFSGLTSGQQDAVLTDMQNGTATGFADPAPAFFAMLVQHAREGTFCDPQYGGNRNLIGWAIIGFPGAQLSYEDADMVVGADQARKPILTLADTKRVPMPAPRSGF